VFAFALAANFIFHQLRTNYMNRHNDNEIVATAKFLRATLKDFQAHQIAMGDRAGATGYLAGVDIVQLEGLVMDKKYLSHVKSRFQLQPVLDEYRPDFYVATDPRPVPGSDCHIVKEPLQATDRVNENTVCYPVVARYTQVVGGPVTVVFQTNPNVRRLTSPTP
jgi:hypothetical protein